MFHSLVLLLSLACLWNTHFSRSESGGEPCAVSWCRHLELHRSQGSGVSFTALPSSHAFSREMKRGSENSPFCRPWRRSLHLLHRKDMQALSRRFCLLAPIWTPRMGKIEPVRPLHHSDRHFSKCMEGETFAWESQLSQSVCVFSACLDIGISIGL